MLRANSVYRKRRLFQLLEILFALLLVLVGLVPLIRSQVLLYKEQRALAMENLLNHTAHIASSQLIQQLYQQEIPWDQLWSGATHPFSPLTEPPWFAFPSVPYEITYSFQHIRSKPRDPNQENRDRKYHLFRVWLTFTPYKGKKKEKKYCFQAFILRDEGEVDA